MNQSGNEWPGPGGGCGECAWVHWYTMSQQSWHECEACPQAIFESCCRSAHDYVAMAIRRYGVPPAGEGVDPAAADGGPARVWGTAVLSSIFFYYRSY